MATPEGGGEWILQVAGSVVGGVGAAVLTIISWAYRAGGKEPELKSFFKEEISAAEKRIEIKIGEAEKRSDQKVTELVGHFSDTFSALRQKINDGELRLEREFLRKEDYKALRQEDRADFAQFEKRIFKEWDDFKKNIAVIIGERKP